MAPCQAGCIAVVEELAGSTDCIAAVEELAGLACYIAGMVVEDLASRIHQEVHLAGKGYFPAVAAPVVEESADLPGCIADKVVVGLAARIHRVHLVGKDFLVVDLLVAELGWEVAVELVGRTEERPSYY